MAQRISRSRFLGFSWAHCLMLSVYATMCVGCGGHPTQNPAADVVADMASVADVMTALDVPDLQGMELHREISESPPEDCLAVVAPNEKCGSNEDCVSGWCVLHRGEKVCTQTCVEECPVGWTCEQMATAGSDPVFICMSEHPSLCLPCMSSDDCMISERCTAYPEGAGAFCGKPCLPELGCPCGFECKEMPTTEGDHKLLCAEMEFSCTCTQYAVANHIGTTCRRSNVYGTCFGWRECSADGLTDCSASLPAAEECDGLDNDCDGMTDDGEVCNDCLCGDGDCNTSGCGECWEENCMTCATDCALCGNGTCDPGEGPEECEVDCCGSCTDGVCKGGECNEDDPKHEKYCPEDCEFPCGDGLCQGGENPVDCPQDCEKYACGNGSCEPGEDPAKCPGDCAQSCGDCACAGGESYLTCPVDCGYCGDGYCIDKCSYIPENATVCPQDCGENCDLLCLGLECGLAGTQCLCGLCEDEDMCLVGVCSEEQQCSVESVDCDDANPCTGDACDPESGCQHAPLHGEPCDDDNPCTLTECQSDMCLATGWLDCDDELDCTTDSCQPAVGCVYELDDGDCDDGVTCTADTCSKLSGCSNVGVDLLCDDDVACTVDTCDPLVGCTHVLDDGLCDGGVECTGQVCDSQVGCLPVVLGDGTECGAGPEWSCQSGECECTGTCAVNECGPDGCTGSCGECDGQLTCLAGSCVGCGDGDCGAGEDQCNCPKDCAGGCAGCCLEGACKTGDVSGNCGAGGDPCEVCEGGEVCSGGDCVCTTQHHQACVNGDVYSFDSCDGQEDKAEECGEHLCQDATCQPPACPDQFCNGDETPCSCAEDCGDCPAGESCQADQCEVVCEDDLCGAGEDKCTCPADCGEPCEGKECGDDNCGGSCGTCQPPLACLDGSCVGCGDGQCGAGEDVCNCPADCFGGCLGCCEGTECKAGTAPTQCGKDGASCANCSSGGETCESQACVPNTTTPTWTDPSSGLEWQNPPNGETLIWDAAQQYCSNLLLEGSGWRLPSISELRTLVRGCPGTVTGGACGVTDDCLSAACADMPCADCSSGGGPAGGCYWPDEMQGLCISYWSLWPTDDLDYAWYVHFLWGELMDNYVDDPLGVRCVR